MLFRVGSGLVFPLVGRLKVKKTSHKPLSCHLHAKHTKFPVDKLSKRMNARQHRLNDEEIKHGHTYRQSSQLTCSAGKV